MYNHSMFPRELQRPWCPYDMPAVLARRDPSPQQTNQGAASGEFESWWKEPSGPWCVLEGGQMDSAGRGLISTRML